MRKLYSEVNEILDSINFDGIWRGFSKFNFALYNNDNVYFEDKIIPHDNRFLGNTSIDFDGELFAIWHVENPSEEDSQVLAANIVHEMFHAFQRSKNESRYPSDLVLLDYPDNLENYTIKYSENLFLVNALLSDNANEKNHLLNKFISARLYREALIGDVIRQEFYAETLEGMAEYAGTMALKQISHEKYTERINDYIKNLSVVNNSFFDIRRMSYYSGALLLVLLSELGKNFYHEIGKTETPVFYLLIENQKKECPQTNFDDKQLILETEKYLTQKKVQFEEFLKTHKNETLCDSYICGYDPMNMIKMNDMILCSHFIMLKNDTSVEPNFIQGPVLVKLKTNSPNRVQSYIK